MKHTQQVALLERVLKLGQGAGTTLADDVTRIPVDAYHQDAQFALEKQHIFGKLPLVFAMSHELPEPGSFKTNDYYGVPLMIARGLDGTARTFLNVCRHRGARISAKDQGKINKVFTCPYHGWCYDLHGKLVHIPAKESFPDVDPACHGLTELPTEERHGLIWGRLEPDADLNVEHYLADFDADFAGYGLPESHFLEQHLIEQPINWKIAIDTFLEPYHFGVLHRNSIAPLFIHDCCLVDQSGHHIREILPRKTTADLPELPKDQWDLPDQSAMVYVLFPNTIWVMQRDHIELWRIYPHPTDTGQCVMTMDFMTPEPVTTEKARLHWKKNIDILMKTVLDEDFPTGAGIQSGLRSGAQTHVTLGRNEPALAMFEKSIGSLTWANSQATG